MASVKENLIAARALIADEAAYLSAYRNTGSAIGWAFDEATDCDEPSVVAMFGAIAPFWVAGDRRHSTVIATLDRAIAACDEVKP